MTELNTTGKSLFRYSLSQLMAIIFLASIMLGATHAWSEDGFLRSFVWYLFYVGFLVGIFVTFIGAIVARLDGRQLSLGDAALAASFIGLAFATVAMVSGSIFYGLVKLLTAVLHA